jgi:hypothetical protein
MVTGRVVSFVLDARAEKTDILRVIQTKVGAIVGSNIHHMERRKETEKFISLNETKAPDI